MRIYVWTVTLTISALIAGQAEGLRPQVTMNNAPETLSVSIEELIQHARENILIRAHGDPVVLERFDRFALSLEALYREERALTLAQVTHILNALEFAAERHQSQTRQNKSHTPYVSHPLGVANNLITVGEVKDPHVIIAALLHDTVENTQTTLEEIAYQFGKEVSSYVQELTDETNLTREERKRVEVIQASHISSGAAQVKLADKLYNLSDLLSYTPDGWTRERVDHYFEWTESVVNRLPRCNPPLKLAIDQIINQYWENQEEIVAKK